MATVLNFVLRPGRKRSPGPGESTGTILVFTGVRYERLACASSDPSRPQPPVRRPRGKRAAGA